MITDKKKSLNEYRYMSGGSVNKTINDPDLYVFATQVIVPLCMKYAKYAFYAKVKASAIKGRNGSDLHRAAFKMELQSLNSDAKSLHRVLCKIYNTNKQDNTIAIDYNAIADGYYDYFASIIDGTVYFTPLSELYRYQAEMGNVCITKGGKYMAVDADYFIDHSTNSYEMEQTDINEYNKAFDRYVNKSYKVTESHKALSQLTMNENQLTIDINSPIDEKIFKEYVFRMNHYKLSKSDIAKVMHVMVDVIYGNMDLNPTRKLTSFTDAIAYISETISEKAGIELIMFASSCIGDHEMTTLFVSLVKHLFRNHANVNNFETSGIVRPLYRVGYECYIKSQGVTESKKRVTSKEKALLEKLSKLTGIRSKSFNDQVLDVIRNR